MINNLAIKLVWARRLTWWSYALFLVSMISGGYMRGTPGSLLIIGTLPLLLMLPGMARENYKSLSMLCFVTLFYFTVTVLNLWSPAANLIDWFSVTLIAILFCAAMMFSRWKQYDLAARQSQTSIASDSTDRDNGAQP
jgi:uncharacterized membrane protein